MNEWMNYWLIDVICIDDYLQNEKWIWMIKEWKKDLVVFWVLHFLEVLRPTPPPYGREVKIDCPIMLLLLLTLIWFSILFSICYWGLVFIRTWKAGSIDVAFPAVSSWNDSWLDFTGKLWPALRILFSFY